ncbi:unnamed protein product [Clavelina lepadiformis]|uniref:Cell division cycle protein 27 homolog n=1 Tax=Clavelina lepadiformis TaxID=159417 RepID=A0ABP0F4F9_CLALP
MVDSIAIAVNVQNVLRIEDDLGNPQCNIALNPRDKFRMLHKHQLYDRIIREWERYVQEQPPNPGPKDVLWIPYYVADAYYAMHQYKESLFLLHCLDECDIEDPDLEGGVIYDKTKCLYNLHRFQEALQFIERVKSEVLHLNLADSDIYSLRGELAVISARCQYALREYQLAINKYKEASENIASVDKRDEPWKEISRANCFYNIGFCLYKLGDYDAAINEAEKSLHHYEQHHGSVNNKCICYTFLGWCHLKRDEYDKALTYFQTELDLRLQFVPTEKQDSDEDIKFARSNIQICQNSLTPWNKNIKSALGSSGLRDWLQAWDFQISGTP